MRTVVALVVVPLVLTGCSPVYAPPIRSAHEGAPRVLRQGRAELNVEGTWLLTGGGTFGLGLSDSLELEAGVDASPTWVMPFAGVRFHAGDGSRAPGIHLLVDAELGAGLGAGGERDCGDEDASCADFPVAGGAYAGAGLGVRIDFFTPFVRARIQETTADGLPATTWGSAVAGFQFSAGEDFHLHLAAGWGGYWNDEDETVGPLGLLGFAVAWDAWPGGS